MDDGRQCNAEVEALTGIALDQETYSERCMSVTYCLLARCDELMSCQQGVQCERRLFWTGVDHQQSSSFCFFGIDDICGPE